MVYGIGFATVPFMTKKSHVLITHSWRAHDVLHYPSSRLVRENNWSESLRISVEREEMDLRSTRLRDGKSTPILAIWCNLMSSKMQGAVRSKMGVSKQGDRPNSWFIISGETHLNWCFEGTHFEKPPYESYQYYSRALSRAVSWDSQPWEASTVDEVEHYRAGPHISLVKVTATW